MSSYGTPSDVGAAGGLPATGSARPASQGGGRSDLADVLERVLDKGIVVVGDIRVDLLDIELLTIKLRLLIAGVDTARRIGINWWESDPWVSGRDDDQRHSLRKRVDRLERQLGSGSDGGGSLEEENESLRAELAQVRGELGRQRQRSRDR
jgi:hypothetical protein